MFSSAKYSLPENSRVKFKELIYELNSNFREPANARTVRNVVDKIILNHNVRVAQKSRRKREDVVNILEEDIGKISVADAH